MKKSWLFLYALTTLLVIQFTACGKDDSVSLADLPPAIKAYVEANYPGYTLDEAETETDCTGAKVYEVEIEQGSENDLELTFDADGNFLYLETEIKHTDLPTAVVNSIASHYAGFTTEELSSLMLPGGSFQYKVELEKGKTDKEVLFDSEGVVICEQDEH